MVLSSSSLIEILLINFCAALVSFISLKHLSSACYRYQIFDYYNLVYHATEAPGRVFVSLLLVLHWLFLVASYMSLFNYFVPNIYKPLRLSLNADEEKLYTLVLTNLFITMPLSMFKDLEHMNFTKFSNAIGIGYIVIISLYDVTFMRAVDRISLVPTGFVENPAFACVFSVYTGYYYLPTLENYLFEPTEARVQKVLVRTLVPIGIVYSFISLSPFLYQTSSEKSWTSISEELMIEINLIVLIPCSVMTLRTILFDILDVEGKALLCFIMSLVITSVACAIALFFDKVIILFCISGVLNCILMTAVPSIVYVVMLNDQWSRFEWGFGVAYSLAVIGFATDGLKAAIMLN